MIANLFGNRFYGHRTKAWHEMGLVSDEDWTAVEALTSLGGGYYFEKRPVFIELNGTIQAIGEYSIVRSPVWDDPKERHFGFATKQYNIIQPLRICELFDENVNQPVETLGMLGKGEKIFLTWQLPEFDIKGDKVEVYGFIACGYDAKYGASLNVVTTRVVCQNTWNAAIREAETNQVEGRGRVWNGRHNSRNIERDLGIWMAHVQSEAERTASLTKSLFTRMEETPVSVDDAYGMLFGIYPNPKPLPAYYPEKLRKEKEVAIAKQQEDAEHDREMVMNLFNGAGTDVSRTAYGLMNSCTEMENWARTTRKSPNYSILFGERANAMNRAGAIITEWMDNIK